MKAVRQNPLIERTKLLQKPVIKKIKKDLKKGADMN